MSLNSRDFRNALGQFTTGVCVATAAAPQGPIGLTINSFASVSLEPRLILWSLDRQSDTFAIFTSASRFGIDILGANARELSARLSRKGEHELHDHELAPRASTPHLKARSRGSPARSRRGTMAAITRSSLDGFSNSVTSPAAIRWSITVGAIARCTN